ncbi:unnamed protein product [Blepharisma stoltei]|uniref:Ubiquitin-like domain-containing protein n=1 Tax=Blepharisma stoltei TaxID=1481888 RepID=A0AAU9IM56_9CILI|nr:unnamed protein product [Blepharisma stoltei]
MDLFPLKHPRRWLTIADKLSIVDEYNDTNATLRDLAEKYNIAHSTISKWVKKRDKMIEFEDPFARKLRNSNFIEQNSETLPMIMKRRTSEKKLVKKLLKRNTSLTEENEKLKTQNETLKEKISDSKEEKSRKPKKEDKNAFYVYLQDLTSRKKEKIKIKDNATVEELKRKIFKKIPSESERLIFTLQELNDSHKRISQYNVKNLSTIMMI